MDEKLISAIKVPAWIFGAAFAGLVVCIVASYWLGPVKIFGADVGIDRGSALPDLEKLVVAKVAEHLAKDPHGDIVSAGSDLPAGAVVAFTDLPVKHDGSATCPSGWEEAAELRGRFVIGADPSNPFGSDNPTGVSNTGGAHVVTLTEQQMPQHKHLTNNATNQTFSPFGLMSRTLTGMGGTPAVNYPTYSLTDTAGGGQAHNNMPPYIAMTWCKRISPDVG